MHETQGIFAQMVVALATVWHTGLLLVSYNPRVGSWSAASIAGAWLGAAALVFGIIYVLSFILRLLTRWRKS